jgi:UDP-glucose 4-epimerase
VAVLVTGGAGYIGSVTVEHLLASGEEVVVLDNLSRGHRESLPPSTLFYQGNAGDAALVKRIVSENEVESCIHFAAYAYVQESVEQPKLYFENNVGQGLALFAALLEAGVPRIILSSSCVTYGETTGIPITEACAQRPTSPYGWTKLLLERALVSYDAAYQIRFAGLRYFNAAGATGKCGEDHDPETHLIPNVLRTAAGELPEVCVFGSDYSTPDRTAIRDYIHVSDLAEAHGRALNYLREGGRSEFLNLGSGRGHSVLEVIECARQVTGKPIPMRICPARAGDPACLVADARKAEKLLGWRPRCSDLATMMRSAWNWHRAHPEGYSERCDGQVQVALM